MSDDMHSLRWSAYFHGVLRHHMHSVAYFDQEVGF